MNADARTVRLDIASRLEMLDMVQAVLNHLCGVLGFNEEAVHYMSVAVRESVVNAILTLVRSARPDADTDVSKLISWGPCPRASQALMLVARARALIDGRLSPSIDDVLAMAEPILKHRMALTFAARADGETMEGVIGKLKTRIG